jgi:hypothetical protein
MELGISIFVSASVPSSSFWLIFSLRGE